MSFDEKPGRFEHRFSPQGCNTLHQTCWNYRADVAEYLLDDTRIDPLAEPVLHALSMAFHRPGTGEAPDRGLPILELFHRKAPQALHMPVDMSGENARGQLF